MIDQAFGSEKELDEIQDTLSDIKTKENGTRNKKSLK